MKPITKAEVIKALRAAIARTPDAINPTDDLPRPNGGCVYHKGRGRNIRRCIIGQVGFDLGLPTPDAEATSVAGLCSDDNYFGENIWADRFTPAAVKLMVDVQDVADGGGRIDWEPVPWRNLRAIF